MLATRVGRIFAEICGGNHGEWNMSPVAAPVATGEPV